MTIDIENLRRLAQAATPGPWASGRAGEIWDRKGNQIGHIVEGFPGPEGTAAHIAAANPKTVLGLIEEIERLRGLLADAVDEIEEEGHDQR